MKIEIWNQIRLEQLLKNESEESIHLEFKDGKALGFSENQKLAISKQVSAMANSDGGTIIYGISEKNHKAHSFSPINGNDIAKEWLENVITSGIQQRFDEFVISPIRLNNDIVSTIYVVQIPVSSRTPHMVNGIYYKRYNFKAVPMEEYEVRLMYGRKQKIILENQQVHISISNLKTLEKDKFYLFNVKYYLKNIGNSVAENYRLRCKLQQFIELDYKFPTGKDYSFLVKDSEVFVSPKSAVCLFPEEDITAIHFTFKISENNLSIAKDLIFDTTLFTEHGNSTYRHEIGTTVLGLIAKAKSLIESEISKKEDCQ